VNGVTELMEDDVCVLGVIDTAVAVLDPMGQRTVPRVVERRGMNLDPLCLVEEIAVAE
jgi:hypothetical protein